MVYNEMGEIYSSCRQKIPGQRITDLCVDSMYTLLPQTPLALKTGTQMDCSVLVLGHVTTPSPALSGVSYRDRLPHSPLFLLPHFVTLTTEGCDDILSFPPYFPSHGHGNWVLCAG